MGGLFSYLASQEMSDIAESKGRMLRAEAEADAVRYAEQARSLRGQQAVSYIKSGVTLEGSPLDVLDHDALVAQENISAIRARGAAGELEQLNQAAAARIAGRNAFIAGITGGAKTMSNAFALGSKLPAGGGGGMGGGPYTGTTLPASTSSGGVWV